MTGLHELNEIKWKDGYGSDHNGDAKYWRRAEKLQKILNKLAIDSDSSGYKTEESG